MTLLSWIDEKLNGEIRATCDKCHKPIYESSAYIMKYGKYYHWGCAHRRFTHNGKVYVELGSELHDPRNEIKKHTSIRLIKRS
jgi:hypothetical protein